MRVVTYTGLNELPRKYDDLFAAAGDRSLYKSRAWFECMFDKARDPGDRFRLYGAEPDDGSTPRGLLICRTPGDPKPFEKGRVLATFDNNYVLLGGPVLLPDQEDPAAVINALISVIAGERPRWDMISIKALLRGSPDYDALVAGFRANGYVIHAYFEYGNWHEPTEGRTFQKYREGRGKGIRKTVSYLTRKFFRSDSAEFRLVDDLEGFDRALADYETVYAASWKAAERYPDFLPRFLRASAANGSLRLGNLYLDGRPVATQLMFLVGGKATIYKTAYDETIDDTLSVGSVLQYKMLEHFFGLDGVDEIDFGIGDEDYKVKWVSKRRENWGLVAYSPRTPRGIQGIFRNIVAPRLFGAIKSPGGLLGKRVASRAGQGNSERSQ